MPTLDNFRKGVICLIAVLVVAVCGYRIAGWSWLDAIYMVSVTVSTVGYKEVHDLNDSPYLMVFTILVIIFGISSVTFAAGGFVQLITQGEIQRTLGERRMTRNIEQIKDHIIVCGYGRMGKILCENLKRTNQTFLVIEIEESRIEEIMEEEYLFVMGDATEEDVLIQAGVERATSIACVLKDDASNVFLTLTARQLNTDINIIARGEQPTTRRKLIHAGADYVVLPAATSAVRIANMITRPSATELFDRFAGFHMLDAEFNELDLMIDEFVIKTSSPLIGQTVVDAKISSETGLIVVGIKKEESERLAFNPGIDVKFDVNDIVIVMGKRVDIESFEASYGVLRK